jgi:2-methylcitrate dehydratase PrpD
VAEALAVGEFGKNAYALERLANPEILAIARRVRYYVDPAFPGPGRFKGAVRLTLTDGRTFDEVEEYNRGSVENPMTHDELRAKFDENARGVLSREASSRLAEAIARLERLEDAGALADLATVPPALNR